MPKRKRPRRPRTVHVGQALPAWEPGKPAVLEPASPRVRIPERHTGETVAHIAGRILEGASYIHAEVLAMAASLVNQTRR